jgi:2-keto-4-pentenoate hydratase
MSDTSVAVADGMRQLLARRAADVADGAEPIGWKIGINAPAIQAHFGLDGAVVGYLTTATVLPADARIEVGALTAPALEVEVAIEVGEGGAVAAVAPALELVDLGAGFDGITSMLAGNILHRGVVFGPWRPGSITLPLDVEMVAPGSVVPGSVVPGSVVPDSVVPAGSLVAGSVVAGSVVAAGSLAEAPEATVAYVADFLRRHGAELRPGDRIIAGSMVSPHPVAAGDRFAISFGELGGLNAQF